jgi:glycosyltransferase involved in cell wall biosynthesis
MISKILFLCTGHLSKDDRVFYHQATALVKSGFEIEIISTKEFREEIADQIRIQSFDDKAMTMHEKLQEIRKRLNISHPQLIIADMPIAVMAAHLYKKKNPVKIIYDITEWIPSKKNLLNISGLRKYTKFISLIFINLYAGFICSGFIFGEYFKSFPFRILYFWKPSLLLPYYPDLKYIKTYPIDKFKTDIHLTFSGLLNKDKGIDAVIKAITTVASIRNGQKFKLRLIGDFPTSNDQHSFERLTIDLPQNFQIEHIHFLDFRDYCSIIGNTHIFLDLRIKDFENSLCLPIKLFYYAACGRPVIYTDLKSISKSIPDFNFGFLVQPNDTRKIAQQIMDYIDDEVLYNAQCNNALNISKKSFNWENIEPKFLSFIQIISSSIKQ